MNTFSHNDKHLSGTCGALAVLHTHNRRKLKGALQAAGLPVAQALPMQWVVDCKAVGDGQQTLRYLARYLYRGVISESDILRCKDGLVTYRWRDGKSGKRMSRTLPGQDFLWLLLQHVLPKGLQRVRNFGFLHHNARRTVQLLQRKQQPTPSAAWAGPLQRAVWRCACGQPMVVVRRRMPAPTHGASRMKSPQALPPDKPDKAQALEIITN